MKQQRSLFGPLLLIAAGAVWLLVKSGNIPSANLWALTHVWPYVLIAAGVGLILRPYWQYVNILLDVVIIGGLVFSIVYAPQFGWDDPSMTGIINIGDSDFGIGPGERGSGNVITESRQVGGFDSIELDYPAEVFITQGAKESLTVEADDDFLPGLQTPVRGNTLQIFYRAVDGRRINPTELVKITIVVTDLKDVQFNSAGELNIDGLETDELKISINGAGNLELKGIAAKDLDINLSGAGSMTASGEAGNLMVNISGFGDYKGADLQATTASVTISGAGSATVWVEEELDARISGAGSIDYYGSPTVTKQVGGLGSINKAGDK